MRNFFPTLALSSALAVAAVPNATASTSIISEKPSDIPQKETEQDLIVRLRKWDREPALIEVMLRLSDGTTNSRLALEIIPLTEQKLPCTGKVSPEYWHRLSTIFWLLGRRNGDEGAEFLGRLLMNPAALSQVECMLPWDESSAAMRDRLRESIIKALGASDSEAAAKILALDPSVLIRKETRHDLERALNLALVDRCLRHHGLAAPFHCPKALAIHGQRHLREAAASLKREAIHICNRLQRSGTK